LSQLNTGILRLLLIFVFVHFSVIAQTIHPSFLKLQSEGALIGYSVRNEQGIEIMSWNSGVNFQPASTQKVITAAAALYFLGKDYRFKTPVLLQGSKDGIVFRGDIVVKGSGDPSFGAQNSEADSIKNAIVNAITKRGIKRISGAIKCDNSIYPYNHEVVPRYWIYEDLGNYYGAGVFGLNWRANSFTVEFRATRAGQVAEYHFVDYTPHNMLLSSEVTTCSGLEEVIYMWGAPGKSAIEVDGCLPPGQIRRERGALPHPPIQFLKELQSSILDKFPGSDVSSQISDGARETNSDTLIIFESRPLSELVKNMLLKSDNLLAEAILKKIAAELGKNTRAEKAVEQVKNYLTALKYPETEYFYPVDGSGLSPSNLMSPRFQTAFLHHLQSQAEFETIYNSLPEAGKTGTLRRFEAIPGMRAKTGSIKGVRTYMGYMEIHGQKYSLSVMINHISSSENKSISEAAAEFLKSIPSMDK
jgi:D-alanyl-D-alanine carboxypeptidase/D-alanyl-D-alanine-endopeptidase (penicillin-binding protein 4)